MAVTASVAMAVFAGLIQAPTQAAQAREMKQVASIAALKTSLVSADGEEDPPTGQPRPIPVTPYEPWDGQAGVEKFDTRLRGLIADIAELSPEIEIREAATKAMAEGDAAITVFFNSGHAAATAAANARKKAKAASDKKAVQAMVGTGGPLFQAEVTRVLAGTDADRANFLEYGKDIATMRDEEVAADGKTRAGQLRARVTMLAGINSPEVAKAAAAALAAGDEAIAAFIATGYASAAKLDAAARDKEIADAEARNKAAEALSELAVRAARASTARANLLLANGEGVHALQQASNAMVSASNQGRLAEQILAGTGTAAAKATKLDAAKTEAARQVGYAVQAGERAKAAAARSTVEANILVETGLTYGADWSLMAQGMHEAANAALGAGRTAQAAIEATIATNAAKDAAAKAAALAASAIKWREHAQEHAKSAASIAKAAKKQADVAENAAARTKAARIAAEAADDKAQAAAERTHQSRLTAEAEAKKAKAARVIAEKERANAASARARAADYAATARGARQQAQGYAATAASARASAERQDANAAAAENGALAQESRAATARDRAEQARMDKDEDEARARAHEAWAAAERGGEYGEEAAAAAREARGEATVSANAAASARAAANTASGAAANARVAATEATRAAARARAAARQAEAAAARADAAADRAEADAAVAHSAARQADVKAAEATKNEIVAAEAAGTAVRLGEAAAQEAVQALSAADRVKVDSLEAANEAVSAATQAENAIRAATTARESAAATLAPADTAITVVAGFTGTDIDADFVVQVAEQANLISQQQAAAAKTRATEALAAATKAQASADKAAAQVKPAYQAAADAAQSAADAAASAARAQQAAADAAADGALARAAATRAANADSRAHADAIAARKAANEAATDAAIAGKNATAAENDAAAARNLATQAENDAATARAAATRAENDAAAAQAAATSAQTHADNAAAAAANALTSAIAAEKAADAAEEEARQEALAAQKADLAEIGTGGFDPSADEAAELSAMFGPDFERKLAELTLNAGKKFKDFVQDNGPEILRDLVIGDLEKCFGERNVSACFWTLVGIVPWSKGVKLGKSGLKLMKAWPIFQKTSKAARKALNDVKVLTRAKKGCQSFVPGTQVLMSSGASKPIESVRMGDLVLATDPMTGRSEAKPVTNITMGMGLKHLVDVRIRTFGLTAFTITATSAHPFWAPESGAWQHAGTLTAGQTLSTISGPSPKIFTSTHRFERAQVHNLTVAGLHTYYVMAGRTPVLVHNAGCDEWAAAYAGVSGGTQKTFRPPGGAPMLGKYRLSPNEDWGHHSVVVKDGRVFDQFTGPQGVPINEWKKLWEYGDVIDFGF
jgi:pretoxin HINT domain-containing protein